MDMMRQLYEEVILDHNKRPRNFNKHPADANREARGFNPLCGDEFTLYLRVHNGVIEDVGFEGHGCAISTASASLMTEALMGKSEAEAEMLFRQMHELLTVEQADRNGLEKEVGKLRVLKGVREFPSRVKCATLAWHTLHAALENEAQTVTTE
jgi:nitrogen fixation protein NifU and related proteins